MTCTYTTPATPVVATLNFYGHAIRLLLIDGKIVFVANDVGCALGYANPAVSIRQIVPAAQRPLVRITGTTDLPRTIVLSFAGLQRLINKSEMSAAPIFRGWLAEQMLDGLKEEPEDVLEVPQGGRLPSITIRPHSHPKALQRTVTPPVAHLDFRGFEIRVVLVEGKAWLVAKDILPALAYRVMREGGSCLRANRVPPYHMHKARLSDVHGQARALLVHPDALPEWMANAETTRRAGPRKILAPAFMAFMNTIGLPALHSIEAAHADLIAA